jgi:hypothetical protein
MAWVTIRELTNDASAVLRQVKSKEYLRISDKTGTTKYEVLVVSHFEKNIDARKKAIRVNLTRLSNNSGFFIHFARDTATPLIVEERGKARYIVEPGEENTEFLCAKFGVDEEALKEALMGSDLMSATAKRIRRMRRKLRSRAKDAASETAHLRYEIARRDEELQRQITYIRGLEAEIGKLRNDLRDYGN